ncbi:MAG: hypothetical protein AAGM22_06670 [Acidobacteriota bacterium]
MLPIDNARDAATCLALALALTLGLAWPAAAGELAISAFTVGGALEVHAPGAVTLDVRMRCTDGARGHLRVNRSDVLLDRRDLETGTEPAPAQPADVLCTWEVRAIPAEAARVFSGRETRGEASDPGALRRAASLIAIARGEVLRDGSIFMDAASNRDSGEAP